VTELRSPQQRIVLSLLTRTKLAPFLSFVLQTHVTTAGQIGELVIVLDKLHVPEPWLQVQPHVLSLIANS
jgi:hypothetical protein